MGFLWILFFVTAICYSIAGFGGGSTYLALMVLWDFPYEHLRPTALLCNLAVVIFGTYIYWKNGFLDLRRLLPFIISSIPMAFLGGTIGIGKTAFSLLLGISLAVAALRMLWIGKALEPKAVLRTATLYGVGIPLGALLGFLAGIIGIGGGIYLAPVLLLLGWTDAKQTAAACSFFILVNSVAGLAGQLSSGIHFSWQVALPLVCAVLIGGQIGSNVGARWISRLWLQRVTGVLILAVSIRLLWKVL